MLPACNQHAQIAQRVQQPVACIPAEGPSAGTGAGAQEVLQCPAGSPGAGRPCGAASRTHLIGGMLLFRPPTHTTYIQLFGGGTSTSRVANFLRDPSPPRFSEARSTRASEVGRSIHPKWKLGTAYMRHWPRLLDTRRTQPYAAIMTRFERGPCRPKYEHSTPRLSRGRQSCDAKRALLKLTKLGTRCRKLRCSHARYQD